MADFEIKQNDLLPEITATLLEPDDSPLDLTGATVRFVMRHTSMANVAKVAAAATVVSPTAGTVKYIWTGTDTDTAGDYLAEWEVTYPAGTLSVPNTGYILVRIHPELA
jgi:hypothetical protein